MDAQLGDWLFPTLKALEVLVLGGVAAAMSWSLKRNDEKREARLASMERDARLAGIEERLAGIEGRL